MTTPGHWVHPQARKLLELRPAQSLRPWLQGIDAVRDEVRQMAQRFGGEPEPGVGYAAIDAGGVLARLYVGPTDGTDCVLVWLHGGGWQVGDAGCYDTLTRALAIRARCAVLSVDYRLAPEHPYPAAVDDCWLAVQWAVKSFARVAVGGDSAGGGLAAAMARRARDHGLALALQLLVYPALDYRTDSAHHRAFRTNYQSFAGIGGYGDARVDGKINLWNAYVPDETRRAEPDASPLRAVDLSGVAPALIITAEHDLLRPEDEEYAQRLRQAGVRAEVSEFPGQIHGFYHLLGLMHDAHVAVAQSAAALLTAFRSQS